MNNPASSTPESSCGPTKEIVLVDPSELVFCDPSTVKVVEEGTDASVKSCSDVITELVDVTTNITSSTLNP